MTVIAWDGNSIAADKQQTNGGTIAKATKLHRLKSGGIATFTGAADYGLSRLNWFKCGAMLADYPEVDGEEYGCFIVWDETGFRYYERTPFPIVVEDDFMAFGSGRDFAIAAMACGKTAREAVEIANRFDNGCGLGVDVMTLNG